MIDDVQARDGVCGLMRIQVLVRQHRVERPLEEVFPFYADAANLEQNMPPWLGFELTTPRPIAMSVRSLDAGPYLRAVASRAWLRAGGRTWRCSATGCGTRSAQAARVLFVQRDLERIFNYRRDAVAALLGEAPRP